MSDLTSVEKLKLEKFLGMSSGYVLDFTNNTFQEFISGTSDIDIFDIKYDYHSGSKANRLRAFWKLENNPAVGNLISKLLDYWKTKKILNKQGASLEEKRLYEECQGIADRLMRSAEKKQMCDSPPNKSSSLIQTQLLAQFDELAQIISPEERKQRGFVLEKLLQDVFKLYQIPTQSSFKRNEGGEQIDGAFRFEGWYYLVECKWTQKLTDIKQLDSLSGKLQRSGKQTLGLFLSMNGWSENVLPLLKQNQDKSIILMDGYDLRCVLDENSQVKLNDLLIAKLEALNLEGQPFYSVKQYIEKGSKLN